MRKAARIVFALLLAYAVQATMLPYFRINGIILDAITVVLYTAGFACGMYAGIVTGLFGALLLEVLSGDLPGLTAVMAVATGGFGYYMARWTSRYARKDNRRLERLIKGAAPVIAVGFLVLIREIIFLLYFYLTGAELQAMHIFRAVQCSFITMLCALLLIPVVSRFILRKAEDTWFAKWRKRRRNRKKPKELGLTIELPKEMPLDYQATLSTQFHVELSFDPSEDTIDEPPLIFYKDTAKEPPTDEGGTEA